MMQAWSRDDGRSGEVRYHRKKWNKVKRDKGDSGLSPPLIVSVGQKRSGSGETSSHQPMDIDDLGISVKKSKASTSQGFTRDFCADVAGPTRALEDQC